MHIGAGALISRGLLARLPLTFMQDCIQDMPYAQGKRLYVQSHVHICVASEQCPHPISSSALGAMVLLSFSSMKHTQTDGRLTDTCTLEGTS